MRRIPIVIALFSLALMTTGPAEADKKKSEGLGTCWLQGKIVYTPGSTKASCCYDDGCYVCDTSWNNCKWESKAMTVIRGVKGVQPGVLDPGPRTGNKLHVAPRTGNLKKQ